MTFDVLTEMQVGGLWNDISSDVLLRDGIDITRGKQGEDGQAPPQTARLTLNNRGGKYSVRNPLGQWYGQIGRNTQIRIGVQVDPVYDAHSSTTGTGNLTWTHTPVGKPTGVVLFVWQYNTNTDQLPSATYGGVTMDRKSVGLYTMGAFTAVGYIYFLNRNIPAGPQSVVVNTNVVTQRQASAITVTGGTNAEIETQGQAYSNATPSTNPSGSLLTVKRSILFGSLLSDLDNGSTISVGAGAYAELGEFALGTETVSVLRTTNALSPGNWLVPWNAAISNWGIQSIAIRTVQYRFWGEVSSFPPKWDASTNDAYVPIEAAGILRRLGQGTDPAQTGLRAFIEPATSLSRYWPLSGAKGTKYSVDVAPQVISPRGYQFFSEASTGINYAYGTDMGSEFLGTGMAFFNSTFGPMRGDIGIVAPYWAFDFVFSTIESTGGMGNFTATFPGYAGEQWSVNFNAGVAQVSFDDGTAPVAFPATGVLSALQDLDLHHVRFKVLQSGANTVWTLYIDGAIVSTGTQAAYVSSGLSLFRFSIVRSAGQERINLAHLAFFVDAVSESWPSAAAMYQAATGYTGEAAGTRINRVAGLAGITLASVGSMSNTIPMGAQHSESALTTIRDAESADLGILTETRDALGLLYRTRASLYNQTPVATINLAAGELAPPFEPIDDDLTTRNDITAVRRDGDTFRLTDTTSRLSTAAPPNGVGPYKDEVTLNVGVDAQLQAMASWLLHLGTVDGARYPTISVALASPNVVANTTLAAALPMVDIGDRMTVTNNVKALIYDNISVLVLGYAERLETHDWRITYNCTPEAPYDVAVYGSGVGTGPDRYDTGGSTLTSGVTSTATSLSVTTAAGNVPWTTVAGEFPFDIFVAGERMTVGGITGSSSPQTFSPVTRSVNGVVKAQSSGAAVRLWITPRYAL